MKTHVIAYEGLFGGLGRWLQRGLIDPMLKKHPGKFTVSYHHMELQELFGRIGALQSRHDRLRSTLNKFVISIENQERLHDVDKPTPR